MAAVRNLAELTLGDVVRTPLKREAEVLGFDSPHVDLMYCDDGDVVSLMPGHLVLVRRAPPSDLPKGFFAGERR
jgi:hypothetical protein